MPPLEADHHSKVSGLYIQDADDINDVLNITTHVMKLIWGKIEKQEEWPEW